MTTEPNPTTEKKKQPIASALLPDGVLVELVHRPEEKRTSFLVFRGGTVRDERSVELPTGECGVPYSASNNLLTHGVVLLPSAAEEYDSEEELLAAVRAFIHRYVDIDEAFEELAAYYVLFTWVHDAFNELPYLRVRGDFGSGKSRCLLTIGSLCYKPMFASGASTVSPLFRIIDSFRGTLILDEADFRTSDEKAEIVKILNNGNARGFPVLRSESTPTKEFNPRAFVVYGPKIVATRSAFTDRALESRCLSAVLGERRLRSDVPLNLPDSFADEARHLRNQLLLFRFRTFGRPRNLVEGGPLASEPRVAQVLAPLATVVASPHARERLRHLARKFSDSVENDRALSVEAGLLEVIARLDQSGGPIHLSAIAEQYSRSIGVDAGRDITPRWVGAALRRHLNITPVKSHGLFVLPASEKPRLRLLFERYGIVERVDLGDIGEMGAEKAR